MCGFIFLLTIWRLQLTSFYWQSHACSLRSSTDSNTYAIYILLLTISCARLSFYWQYDACSLHHSTDNLMHAVYIPLLIASYVHLGASIKNLLCATIPHLLLLRIPFKQFISVVDKTVATLVKRVKADTFETRKTRMLCREF